MWIASLVLFVLWFLFLLIADLIKLPHPRSEIIIFQIVPGVLVFVALISRYNWRRSIAVTARDEIERDQRPPVLFLRSFTEDRSMGKRVKDGMAYVSQEELIVFPLKSLGPVIGLGRPGDELPLLGIARDYVSDDQWHQTVHEYINKAGHVFILTNTTEGLSWEICSVIRNQDPAQVYVLVRRGKRKYHDFCEKFKGTFPKPLPKYQRGILARTGGITGIISFDQDWTAHFHRIGYNFLRSLKDPVSSRLRCAIADILNLRGVQYSRPKIKITLVLVLVFVVFAIIVSTISLLKMLVTSHIR
jgi:hypothetical protein